LPNLVFKGTSATDYEANLGLPRAKQSRGTHKVQDSLFGTESSKIANDRSTSIDVNVLPEILRVDEMLVNDRHFGCLFLQLCLFGGSRRVHADFGGEAFGYGRYHSNQPSVTISSRLEYPGR